MKRSCRCLAFCVVCVLSDPVCLAAADDPDARLREVRQRIEQVQQALLASRGSVAQARQDLEATEKSIGVTLRKLRDVGKQRDQEQTRLRELQAEAQRQQDQLTRERRVLSEQLRATHRLGRRGPLVVALSQQDPLRLSRLLTYFDFLNRQRAGQVRRVASHIQQLTAVRQEVRRMEASLRDAQGRIEQRQRLLAARRVQRQAAITALEGEARDQRRRLQRLHKDEAGLSRLLKSLREALADIPGEDEASRPFAELRGALPWPVKGRLLARFGEARPLGGRRWTGTLIATRQGRPVRAVAPGRVAYADWLPGFGLLMILDHGDGYMSLYGYNQSLYKEPGDWVRAGEVLGVVGRSGGRSRSGVYFEIRHDGRPLDPLKWCRAGRGTQVG